MMLRKDRTKIKDLKQLLLHRLRLDLTHSSLISFWELDHLVKFSSWRNSAQVA